METIEEVKAYLENDDNVQDVIWEDVDGFETVEKQRPYDTDRWHTYYKMTAKHIETDTFWNIDWRDGSTEYQDCDFEPRVTRVYPHEVMQIVYKTTPQVDQ